MKQLYFLFLIFSIPLCAQNESTIISGEVKNDSLSIENVHIINLNSNIGTVTNQFGVYKIPVKLNDTIQFSEIRYKSKLIIINKNHLANKSLQIKLQIKINVLEEVIVDQQKNTRGINAMTLNLPNAEKKPLNQIERKLNYYSQASVPIVIIATILGQRGGIEDIYNIISGNRKKHKILNKLLDEDKIHENNQEYVEKIRNHFQDDFFINTIAIPKEKINNFINYCLPKNIIDLFNKSMYIEIIDVFIKESKIFNEGIYLTKD